MRLIVALALFAAMFPGVALAEADVHQLVGSQLSILWAIPFAGMLLSIALFPLIAPHFWEHNFGKIAMLWAAAFVLPCAIVFGPYAAAAETAHTIAVEYLPFLILLFALFVIAGGIRLVGDLAGTPRTNTAILAFGTMIASLVGTTGASMLLIRPMIQANRNRRRNIHVFIFFIFLVSNIGGSLTPLGDPPLFLGFLKGVDFLWTVKRMFAPMVVASGLLLALFYAIDTYFWRQESHRGQRHTGDQLRIDGLHNVSYLASVVGAVLLSGLWHPGIALPIGFGIELALEDLTRDIVLLVLSYLSWKTTPRTIRIENAFTWIPIQEVAILFAGIFLTMIPTLAILRAGHEGSLSSLVAMVSTSDGRAIEGAYFWLTGGLSSFLDNAPTYLVFFNLAGGDAHALMGPGSLTLIAISAGAVFMGANSYIGNAPNFMVKSICEERGIKMPSFFGYLLWSGGILLPLFGFLTWLFF
ncbi:MAG: sodium:proton antiporter [Candidatus Binatus sp.]|uniref:sodium:proton antiporter n=1 Tax=Candidatus Binatus sp. TaxID=2811406 RepID=UPI00271DD95C|nr:sodium:proton antiporter [Candidatus Binatus sp.]MDO8431733.1 sodium:proton antiporter [Candidatus Binatus sp.]